MKNFSMQGSTTWIQNVDTLWETLQPLIRYPVLPLILVEKYVEMSTYGKDILGHENRYTNKQ